MDPITQSYLDVKPMLHLLTQLHWRQFGGDYDDLFAEACLAFTRAYHTYNPERGAFTTFIWCTIKHHLIGVSRRKKLAYRQANLDSLPCRKGFDLESLLKEMSPDAATLIWNLLGAESQRKSKKKQQAVEKLLEVGWSGHRVRKAIREVQEVLA